MMIILTQDRAVYTCDGGYRLVGVEKVRVIIKVMVMTEIPRYPGCVSDQRPVVRCNAQVCQSSR